MRSSERPADPAGGCNVEAQDSSSTAEERKAVWFLPVVSLSAVSGEDALASTCKLAHLAGKVMLPASLTFVLTAGGGLDPMAGFEVTGCTAESAEDARQLIGAVARWIELGPPTDTAPWGELLLASYYLTVGIDPPMRLLSTQSLLWPVAASDPDKWALRAQLACQGNDYDSIDDSVVLGKVELHGTGRRRGFMAELLVGDIGGPVSVLAEPIRSAAPRRFREFPLLTFAHILATPSRLPDGFLSQAGGPESVLRAFRRSPCPHSLILGASGQGKSTLLEHLIADACGRGEPVVVVDGHDGRLAAASIEFCTSAHLDPVVADFSTSQPPLVGFTVPPEGVSPEEWASELYEVIRNLLWGDMPADYFGPVGERSIRLALEVLVRDPEGPLPITDVMRLLDPSESAFRDAVLDRIGDLTLTRSINRELLPMLCAKDAGNAMMFITSKFDPLIGNGYLRRLMAGPRDTLGIEGACSDRRPFLLHVPPGRLGDAGSRLIAGVVLQRLWLASRRRAVCGPIPIFLDEWQRFAVPALGALLAEGRKYNIRLHLANQTLAQVPTRLRDTVLANVGCVASFRTGPGDADLIEPMFPTVARSRLQRLAAHHVALTTGDVDFIVPSPAPLRTERPPDAARG